MALIVSGERVVLAEGVRAASIHIDDGRIVAIGDRHERPAGVTHINAGEHVVSPGIVDTHVHLNDPGRADWEGFDTGTRAAAAGGITTIVDMPLNSFPPTIDVQAFDCKRKAATGRCQVDLGFWGGVVPGNARDLALLAQAGVLGFKCFLSPSGIEDFAHVTPDDLREALPIVASLGLPLLVHAESPSLLREPSPDADPRQYRTWLATRPPEAEHAAITLLIHLAREFGAHIHIVHLASAGGLAALGVARADSVAITVETCPHYLSFAAEHVPDGATAFKCAPPIREQTHRELLWDALTRDAIDLIATDHSPAPPALKKLDEGDFLAAWGGIASLQVALAAVWTGASKRGIGVDRLAGWLSAAPARLAGLSRSKGAIAVGRDADLIIWDPDKEFVVDAHALYHRHAVTPYHGATLRGVVHTTLLRGAVVFDAGECRGEPRGRLLSRHD